MADKGSQLILVIDDDAVGRSAVIDVLRAKGYEVIEAADGKEGLEQALAQHPALIVCDNLMPTLNGTEMVAELRTDSWGAAVPVILLTSQYDVKAVNESIHAGKTDFLLKDDMSLEQIGAAVGRRLAA